MEQEDDYMTTNRLLDQLAASIKQNSIQTRLYISQDLLNKINRSINQKFNSANDLVSVLLERHIDLYKQANFRKQEEEKYKSLLEKSNQKLKKMQFEYYGLKQQLKKQIEKTNKQIRDNNTLKGKLIEMQELRNNCQSMQKTLSSFQTSHQQNQKKTLTLKEQNQKIKDQINSLKADLRIKMSLFFQNIKQQLQDIKVEQSKKSQLWNNIPQQIQTKINEIMIKRLNEERRNNSNSLEKNSGENNQQKQQIQNSESQHQDKTNIINSQQPKIQQKIKDQNNQQKVSDSHISNVLNQQINRIPFNIFDELNQYISNNLDPQLQSKIIEVNQYKNKLSIYKNSIQQLIRFIYTLLTPFDNKDKIQNILSNLTSNLDSNQLFNESLKSLKTVSPVQKSKKHVVTKQNEYVVQLI